MSLVCKRFTFIELLVVLALIMLLATFAFSVQGQVRTKTKSIQCVYNLKSVGEGFYLYALNNGGVFPHEDRGSGGKPPVGCCWIDVIPDYLGDGLGDLCRETWSPTEKVFNKKAECFYSYKMNSRLEDFQGSPLFRRPSSIAYPSSTVLIFDGRLDKKYYQYRMYGIFTAVYQRHAYKAHILFCDGHVAAKCNNNTLHNNWLSKGMVRWSPDR